MNISKLNKDLRKAEKIKEFEERFGFPGSTTLLRNGNCQRDLAIFLSEALDSIQEEMVKVMKAKSKALRLLQAMDETAAEDTFGYVYYMGGADSVDELIHFLTSGKEEKA